MQAVRPLGNPYADSEFAEWDIDAYVFEIVDARASDADYFFGHVPRSRLLCDPHVGEYAPTGIPDSSIRVGLTSISRRVFGLVG